MGYVAAAGATAVRPVDPGTSPPRRFTSPVNYRTLLRSRFVSPGPLLSLGVVVSQDDAALQGLRRPLKVAAMPSGFRVRPRAGS